jgi:hypothetical protein
MGFKRFDPEDFVVSADTVTSTVWSGFQPTLNTYFTSSVQKEGTSGPYYLNVFQTSSVAAGSEIQFAIAFGDKTGRGAVQFDSGVPQLTPSRVNYGQYRTLVLEDENADFVYGLNFSGSYFYALNVERARYKESLFPGSFNLTLSKLIEKTAASPPPILFKTLSYNFFLVLSKANLVNFLSSIKHLI